MVYEWTKTIFTPEDFDGSGQYIVREHKNKEVYKDFSDTGYLSTVMYKVGYIHYTRLKTEKDVHSHLYILISMSDGWSIQGYYTNTKDSKGNKTPSETWGFVEFSGEDNHTAKSKICDFLNNNQHEETYRFATNEELIRVAAYQKLRTK